jgi:hypothetical protein
MVHPVYADLPTTIFEEMSGFLAPWLCGRRPAKR